VDDLRSVISPLEELELNQMLSVAIVGSPETVRSGLGEFIERTRPDELIVAAQIFDHAARLRSYEITASARAELERAGLASS
jgi:alkanesulfonate monooxygenase SsuD/methylene tetrahydromethanopterin reductase-like flavin-dependent oxidoreductase (luciferase family)